MSKKIINFFFISFNIFFLFLSLVYFKLTKKNLKKTNSSMIRMFCLTGGLSNDLFSYFTNKKITQEITNEGLNEINLLKINQNLNQNGYHVIENFLPEKICEEIENHLLSNKLIARGTDMINEEKEIYYDPLNPSAIIYEMDKDKIFQLESIQSLIFNQFLLKISENYFKSVPLFDHISLTLSAKSKVPDSKSAQKFHFDLDRPKWLKYFIYLNDVDENNGPHYFVPATHKNFGIKYEIRSKGYSRIDDELIEKHYSNIKKITGKKGTLIIEDTRGLHKGSVVKDNHRSIVLIQFNNSYFGENISKFNLSIKNRNNFDFYQSNKYTYSNLNIKN